MTPKKTITAKRTKAEKEGEPDVVVLHDNIKPSETWTMSVEEFEAQYYQLVIE